MRVTETTLGVGEATRDDDQSCIPKRPVLGTGPCFLGAATAALGACIESRTDIGGVFVRLTVVTLAVGVADRLGYIVLARESGRGGEEAAARAAVLVARMELNCSWARRASSAAT